MLDYSKLYRLGNKLGYNPQLVHTSQIRQGFTRKQMVGFANKWEMSEPAKWSFFDTEILGATVIPDEPLRFIYKRQAKLLQYTKCEVCFHFFHESVVELLTHLGATGISYYPTIIEHKKEKRTITDYWGLQISGRYGKMDALRSERVPHTLPNGNIVKRNKGIYFENDNWDGLDFSVGEHHSFIVVSERMRTILLKNKVTGVVVEPLTNFLWS